MLRNKARSDNWYLFTYLGQSKNLRHAPQNVDLRAPRARARLRVMGLMQAVRGASGYFDAGTSTFLGGLASSRRTIPAYPLALVDCLPTALAA